MTGLEAWSGLEMLEIKKENIYINLFDNISELTNYLTTRPHKPDRANESNDSSSDFTGTRSFDESVDLFKFGDERLYERIKENKNKINIDELLGNAMKRRSYEKNVYGCVPNVPAYLMGNPINMLLREENNISQKIVNIVLDVCCPWYVEARDIEQAGTRYLIIIDLLEKAGYRCNLYAGTSSECGDIKHILLTKIKTDREPLNMKKMCFPIANPSMLRRIYFRWEEVNDGLRDFTQCGYGHYFGRDEVQKIVEKELKKNFIVWSYKEKRGEFDIKEVLDQLEKTGIHIFE